MPMVALVETDALACAAAVTVTVCPGALASGAVYGIGSPFGHAVTLVAVTGGIGGMPFGYVGVGATAGTPGTVVKKPQPLAHTCQSTPAFDVSLTTEAVKFTTA